ncbi:MAG: cysteine desulfurase [Deltaproteobacteria bacterium]|nr:cysteine desulfurase [Deltaproteobacteria bacterium]
MKRVYFDYNATTPLDPQAALAVERGLTNIFGNPSSIHREGCAAKRELDDARHEMASFLGCHSDEIIFSGSGSESNNLAIKGIAESYREKGSHIVTSVVEHPSVLKTCQYLESRGYQVTYLPVDEKGFFSLADLASAVTDETVLVTLMMANNETGIISPVREAAAIAQERGALFHTDAVQAVGKINVNVQDLGVDLLSLAGHKFYGPKGSAVLYVKKGVKVEPQNHGGGQEGSLRAGTENIPAIMGLAEASKGAKALQPAEYKKMQNLRELLKEGLCREIDYVSFNGESEHTLPNTLSVTFDGISGESLIMALDLEGFSLSAGSACASGAIKPSHVLTAMGLDEDKIKGTIRISLGRWNTKEDVENFLNVLPTVLKRLGKG